MNSDGMTGILPALDLNASGATRGYLGIELTRAPINPGSYFILVESIGPTPYRIRIGADLVHRTGQESEYLGAYRICTVAGGEFLDENFQRFPGGLIQVAQPSRLYLRVRTQPGAPDISAVLHATRQNGEVVETGVGITAIPLARSGYNIAAFVGIPESNTEPVPSPDPQIHLATWFGRLEARGGSGGGSGTASVARQGGRQADISFLLAGAESVTPIALYARFLRRGCYQPPPAVVDLDACLTPPPDGNPYHAGQVQETDIVKLTGGPGPRDYYMEKVDILIEARQPSLPGMPRGPRIGVTGDLFVRELPNSNYHLDKENGYFRLFFDGTLFSSTIDAGTGTVAGPLHSPPEVVSLHNGVAVLSLFSVARARHLTTTGNPVSTDTPYRASIAAQLVGITSCFLCASSTGPFEVLQWVDERTYVRNGSGLQWVARLADYPAPDWLEARAFDYLAAPQIANHPEATEVFSRVQHLRQDWSLGWAWGMVYSEAPDTIRLRPSVPEFRVSDVRDGEESRTSYHGVVRHLPMRWLAEWNLSHEARHCWQFSLRTAGGRTDIDADFLPTNPPSGSPELTDAAFDPTDTCHVQRY